MSDDKNNSGPAEAIKGVVEDAKGKAKEAVGTVAGRNDLVEEGKADGTIDSALDTDAVVKFAHALGLGFLLHRILDTPLPEQRHWQAVIERLLVAASPTPSSEDRP